MKNYSRSWFTFIELLIVISLILLILTFVYLPYAHYQEKIKTKQVVREVSQAISEARNMAINWFDGEGSGSWVLENKSIGLFLSNEDDKKNTMYFYSYPFDLPAWSAQPRLDVRDEDTKLIKERKLPTGTQFDTAMTDLGNIFFFFTSISGSGSYYNVLSNGSKDAITATWITLDFSYKWSTSPILQKTLIYDTRINTVDF